MPEPLRYIEVGGRLQCLNKLTADKQAELLAGAVERIHELTPDGSTTEDQATGKVQRDGHRDDQDHGGHLTALREQHRPRPPNDPNGTKPQKGGK